MAGNPKPMPDDKFEKFAKMLIKICTEIATEEKKPVVGQF